MCSGFSNFQVVPAPLAVLAFLALVVFESVGAGAALAGLVTRRARLAGIGSRLLAAAGLVYLETLLGLSFLSRERTLRPGEEKSFCEVDCHLAYSVVAVESVSGRCLVTLRVRFDADTIAPWRPRDLPVTPDPRVVRLIDPDGRTYAPEGVGSPVLRTRPLEPGESDLTRLAFDLPPGAAGTRLLLTEADWRTRFLLGHENSFLHRKTFFAVERPGG